MRETEKFHRIFNREFDPQESTRRLLEALVSPGGMEEFVEKHNGRLIFKSFIKGDHSGFLACSSMTPNKGEFVLDGGDVRWRDLTTGKEFPCYTMVLDENVGRGMRATYRHAIGERLYM